MLSVTNNLQAMNKTKLDILSAAGETMLSQASKNVNYILSLLQ